MSTLPSTLCLDEDDASDNGSGKDSGDGSGGV